MPAPAFDVYLVTDRAQTRGRDLLWVIEAALDGGILKTASQNARSTLTSLLNGLGFDTVTFR